MYKVLVDNAKIPVIAGKNQKVYFQYNKDHELDCQHTSLQNEFDKLVERKIIGKKIDKKIEKAEPVATNTVSQKEINQ